MSKDSRRKSYEKGYKDSKNAKPIDDVSKGMGVIFGQGWFKSEEEKSYDKGWEDGSNRRNSGGVDGEPFNSSGDYSRGKKVDEYSSNSYEEFSNISYGKTFDENEAILYYPSINIKIAAILIGVVIIFFLVKDPESFLNTTSKKSYTSQLLTFLPGRMYELSWGEDMARPFEVQYGEKKYKTYNYFIENERGMKPLKGDVFGAEIHNPWRIRLNREIQFRILFTKPAILSIRDVTGKFKNSQLNEDGNFYEKFRNY